MPAIDFALGQGLGAINYSIFDYNANKTVASGSLDPGSQSLDLTPGSSLGRKYRAHFYAGTLPLKADIDGMRTTFVPFSFIEYNFSAPTRST